MKAKTVIVLPHNHFDPSWRRCFDRKSRLGEHVLASYAQIEKEVIDRWLDYGQPFTEGQAAVLEKYLEKRPQNKETLQKLAVSGRFACPMAGQTVQGTNLPAPEGLIRNFLCAIPFYRALLGEEHAPLRLMWDEDAFGGSPNYPQIIRGTGADVICRVYYHSPKGRVWQGLDGSRVAWLDSFYPRVSVAADEKHLWCDSCLGEGCERCGETGVRFVPELGYDRICASLEEAAGTPEEFVVVNVGGEEILPERELKPAIDDTMKKYPHAEIRMGTVYDVFARVKKELLTALEEDECEPEDLNPVFPGCFSSRIDIKQRVRDLSYRLCAAESGLARQAFTEKKNPVLPESFNLAWRKITFCQFHDIITGTLSDSAYAEAMEMLNEAEEIIEPFVSLAPAKWPRLTDCASGTSGLRALNWGSHEIAVDDQGILSVTTNGRQLMKQQPNGRLRRPFRIGELAVETDAGDAWGTRIPPLVATAVGLGDFQRITHLSPDRVVWSGCYPADDYMIKKIEWTTALVRGEKEMLYFFTQIDWDTCSRGIKAIFPVDSEELFASYEVPFGHADRAYDSSKVDYLSVSPNYMVFPAQNWVMKKTDETTGVAVFNRGIPGFKWVPGCFEMNLLRSPQFHFCANEPQTYDFNDFNGLRDTGVHQFEYALLPFTDAKTPADLTRLGFDFNMPYDFSLPFTVSKNVTVTAFKPAEDGNGFILRYFNPDSNAALVELRFQETMQISKCTLLEKDHGGAIFKSAFTDTLRGFGIETLRLNWVK
jgi:alpha-mannosidase